MCSFFFVFICNLDSFGGWALCWSPILWNCSITMPKIYGCESLTVKKAKQWKIDAFELWYWRKLLRVPWTARRSNQSILKEIIPGCSLEGLMLKLKLQYFGHLMWRVDSLEKTMMLGGIEGRGEGGDREWDGWMASPTQWTWVWKTPGVGDGQGGLACCDSWGHKESDMTERPNWVTDWTSKTILACLQFCIFAILFSPLF